MTAASVSTLRRSTLQIELRDRGATPWPPPDIQAAPDAVAIRPLGVPPSQLFAFTREIAAWGSTIILDVPMPEVEPYLAEGISIVRCCPERAGDVRELHHTLAGTEIGIEVLAVKPAAILHLRDVCEATSRLASIATDPSLLSENYGLTLSTEVDVFAYPRGQLIRAAHALGVPAIGRVPLAGQQSRQHPFMTAAKYSFAVGFQGGLCFTWEDVRECNACFQPDPQQVEQARRILAAMAEGYAKGLGAVSLDGRMIDIAFIPVAQRTIQTAEQALARQAAVARAFRDEGTA